MQKFCIYILLLLFISCGGEKKTGLILPEGGKKFTLVQRNSTEIKGYDRNLYVKIDDITSGATFLLIKDGENFLVEKNISEGQKIDFEFDGSKYIIECTEQRNVLIGDDEASFVIRIPTDEERSKTGFTEDEKIEKLIGIVATSDVIFIRNGDEYPADEAADHLRTKWNNARGQVKTLDDFIEHIASYSSTSGEPYQIKISDGTTLSSNDWMKEQVKFIK